MPAVVRAARSNQTSGLQYSNHLSDCCVKLGQMFHHAMGKDRVERFVRERERVNIG